MNDLDNVYQPSLAGRMAQVLLPVMQRLLPHAVYKPIYDGLYNTYKTILRWSYLFTLARSSLSSDARSKLKSQLVWKLLPYTMGGRKALENAFDVVAHVEQKKIPGALVECGVAEGGTAAMLALASNTLGQQRRVKWFFDSYEGLPEPTEQDYIDGKAGGFIRPLPKGSCLGTIEQVGELMFDNLGFSKDEVHLIKGWFQDTLPVHRDRFDDGIAVLRLDGDWYESTMVPLQTLYDKVSSGGIVIIDDYGTCYGAERATREFRAERGITTPLIPDGRGGVWFEKP